MTNLAAFIEQPHLFFHWILDTSMAHISRFIELMIDKAEMI